VYIDLAIKTNSKSAESYAGKEQILYGLGKCEEEIKCYDV
jgi:hypothetical protein